MNNKKNHLTYVNQIQVLKYALRKKCVKIIIKLYKNINNKIKCVRLIL